MKLATAKVLRVTRPNMKTVNGVMIPRNIRVKVMSFNRETARAGRDKVKVKVEDKQFPELQGAIIVAAPSAFRETKAGRPVGT